MFVIVTFYEQQHEKLCVCALESRHSQSYYHLLYNVEQTYRIAIFVHKQIRVLTSVRLNYGEKSVRGSCLLV